MKATLATVKSFIRKNDGKLFIKCRASFDGMVDGLEWNKSASFQPTVKTELHNMHTLGISGAWFVLRSHDHISPFSEGEFAGFAVSNSCGYFSIATKKEV